MSPKQLRHASYALLKLKQRFEKAGHTDGALKLIAEELNATWRKAYAIEEARELVAAERKDKGAVLWTVFQPAKHGGRRSTTRTPSRIWTEEVGGLFAHAAVPRLAYLTMDAYGEHFRRAMEKR